MTPRYKAFLLILLGAFTAFAPMVNNTLGPILSQVAAYFGVTDPVANLGLTASMAGLAAGQLIIGPLSDKYGRRNPVLIAVALFTIASVGVALSTGIASFIAWRALQGIGGAGGIVIARSIAADNFKGHELLTVIAITSTINGIAPIVAPVASGACAQLGGWQATFVMLAIVGAVMLAGCYRLRESLPDGHRSRQSLLATYGLYGKVLRNKQFVLFVLHQCLAEAILFGNIASVWSIVGHYGYDSMTASLTLSVNGVFIAIGAGGAARFRHATSGVKASCIGMLALSSVTLGILLTDLGFWPYEIALCALLLVMGFTLTASTTLALESERKLAGTASALFGAMGFVAGGAVAPLVALGNPLVSTALVFSAGAVASSIAGYFALRAHRQAQAA